MLGCAATGQLYEPAPAGATALAPSLARPTCTRGEAYDAPVERSTIVKRINCVCGKVVEGKDDVELWEKAQAHLAADHPDLVGKVSRDDILAQAEEV